MKRVGLRNDYQIIIFSSFRLLASSFSQISHGSYSLFASSPPPCSSFQDHRCRHSVAITLLSSFAPLRCRSKSRPSFQESWGLSSIGSLRLLKEQCRGPFVGCCLGDNEGFNHHMQLRIFPIRRVDSWNQELNQDWAWDFCFARR